MFVSLSTSDWCSKRWWSRGARDGLAVCRWTNMVLFLWHWRPQTSRQTAVYVAQRQLSSSSVIVSVYSVFQSVCLFVTLVTLMCACLWLCVSYIVYAFSGFCIFITACMCGLITHLKWVTLFFRNSHRESLDKFFQENFVSASRKGEFSIQAPELQR
jgi:hypothetical protein